MSWQEEALYLHSPGLDVRKHFGLELYLLRQKKLPRPILLFWQTRPTLMLGRYQVAAAEINVPYAREHQLVLVRRQSGGGCIYTDEGGFQYSLILPETDEGGEDHAFAPFVGPLLTALQDLGLPVVFSGRNDLLLRGKKFSGTAQYREGGYLLHHGSLLFSTDLEALEASTTPSLQKLQAKGISSVRERVCNLSDFLPGMAIEDFRRALLPRLLGLPTGELPPSRQLFLPAGEWEEVRLWGAHYFSAEEALAQREPPYSVSLEGEATAGRFCLQLNLRQGKIQDAVIQGDFFGDFPQDILRELLRGVPARPEAVLKALQSPCFPQRGLHLRPEELAKLFSALPS